MGGTAESRRRRRRLLGVAAVVTALGALPPLQARGKAAAVLAEAVGAPFPRPFAAEVIRREVTLDGVTGDLYDAGPLSAPILLLPGAAPQGRHDPRVQKVSRALARAERTVFVPDLELSKTTFDRVDIDRIVRSVTALEARPPRRKVVVLGFSYGGAFALIAAADERARERIEVVATFGTYFDLVGVLQAATTGVSTVGGQARTWQAHPKAREVVREVVVRMVEPAEADSLEEVFAGTRDASSLSDSARSAYDLATNTDPGRTAPLAAGLDARARGLLADFSPSTMAARITVPVVALHSEDDPLVPYAELLRLRAALPGAQTMTVQSIKHVDLQAGGSRTALVRDVVTAWRFTSAILDRQE
jgi:pimeloyl-ACP methyl ester carboxylesterase